jgi:hypothetical protein
MRDFITSGIRASGFKINMLPGRLSAALPGSTAHIVVWICSAVASRDIKQFHRDQKLRLWFVGLDRWFPSAFRALPCRDPDRVLGQIAGRRDQQRIPPRRSMLAALSVCLPIRFVPLYSFFCFRWITEENQSAAAGSTTSGPAKAYCSTDAIMFWSRREAISFGLTWDNLNLY